MLEKTLALILFATSLLAAEPDKLTKLRGSYESAITKATAPIQETYITELEKLKIEFTKAGKLEDALAVALEIKKLSTPAALGTASGRSSKAELLDYLFSHVWAYSRNPESLGGDYEIIFLPNGTFTQPDPAAPAANKWSWTSDNKGQVNINNAGEIRFKLGDMVIEHPLRDGTTRWLIRTATPLPPHVAP